MYIKFCRSYDGDKKDEARANLSPGSKLSVELEGEKGRSEHFLLMCLIHRSQYHLTIFPFRQAGGWKDTSVPSSVYVPHGPLPNPAGGYHRPLYKRCVSAAMMWISFENKPLLPRLCL